MNKSKRKNPFSYSDFKFALYSLMQGLNAVLVVVLVIRISSFNPNTNVVGEFLTKADKDLHAAIDNTAVVVSNMICLVYSMPQFSSVSNQFSSTTFASDTSVGSSTNYNPRYVSDFQFCRFSGRDSFSCSDVGGVFSVGDLWIDGTPIISIHDKGFVTSLSPWFAKTVAKSKPPKCNGVIDSDAQSPSLRERAKDV